MSRETLDPKGIMDWGYVLAGFICTSFGYWIGFGAGRRLK